MSKLRKVVCDLASNFSKRKWKSVVGAGGRGIIVDGAVWKEKGGVELVC